MSLKQKDVTLSTKKKVKLTQLSSLHNFAAIDILGSEKSSENLNAQAFAMKLYQVKMMLAIQEVDGKPVPRPTSLQAVYEVGKLITDQELNEISLAFNELNGYKEEKDVDFLKAALNG